MSTSRHINRICAGGLVLALVLTLLLMNGGSLGLQPASKAMGYESRVFDSSRVHTLDIVIDDWDGFLETCENEEYSPCAVVIDGEGFKNVGLRAKGNTSLSNVSSLGSDRYSFKLEFDHYDSGKSYHSLDKLCLNNVIQDNTYLKDYLTYQMMRAFGVAAPLCSFIFLTVNGQDWGLYLAVEGVEDSFLRRNYGAGHGALYKPDSMSFGAGRGNGREFNMEGFPFGDQGDLPAPPEVSEDLAGEEDVQPPGLHGGGNGPAGGRGMGSDDVKLKYAGDSLDSYANIFDNAKTEVSEADQNRLVQALKALGEGDVEAAVDVDKVLRYFVVHNFVVNGDSYTGSMVHNYYLYEEDGLLSMIPWDYNLAFGTFQGNSAVSAVNDPIDTPLSVTGSGDRPMADWIASGGEYTALYHQYFARFLETVDPAAIIDEAYALIAPYMERDPSKFCTQEAFEAGVEALKAFCALRAESVSGQLAGTVPSTNEGQAADSSALVDASGLALSAMGTMSQGGGRPPQGGAAPDSDRNSAFPGWRGGRSEAGFSGEDGDRPPEQDGGVPYGGAGGSGWVAISALALLGGVLLARRYKRFGK